MTAYYAVANDGELSEIIVRGMKTVNDLDEVECYRFDLGIAGYLLPVEQAFAASRSNLYLQEDLAPLKTIVKGILVTPGCREWWAERSHWFTLAFQATVEDLLANETIEGNWISNKPSPNE